jgi:hypothetical protein
MLASKISFAGFQGEAVALHWFKITDEPRQQDNDRPALSDSGICWIGMGLRAFHGSRATGRLVPVWRGRRFLGCSLQRLP